MTRMVKLSLVTAIALGTALSADNEVVTLKGMFEDGKGSGNVRSIYSGYSNDNDTDTYATAIGLQLKYELAKYKGFNAGVAFTTSHDIHFISGDKDKGERNDELSSSKGSYTELTEAYINYEFEGLNLRIGRQVIDTPLADSDDIRMVPNTFEAYMTTYEVGAFSIVAGHLNRWQGADAGLDDGWVKTGKDGVNLAGVTFSNNNFKVNGWCYNISNASASDIINGADNNGNNAIYIDASTKLNLSGVDLTLAAQYLSESEQDSSNVEANIYGVMAEVVVSGLSINIAYNKSRKEVGKHSFSGYGGGALFTNMDTMILDEITEDRDAEAIVAGLSYSIGDFNLLYAYGDFKGDADSNGAKAHIVEQDIGVEYTPNDNFTFSAIYVIDDNKEDATSTDFNSKNFRVLASYNF